MPEDIPISGYDSSITFPNLSPYSTYRVEVGIGNAVAYNDVNSLESTATTLQAGSKYSLCIFNIWQKSKKIHLKKYLIHFSIFDRKTQLTIELNYILLDTLSEIIYTKLALGADFFLLEQNW